ncbi:MAG: cytochrome c [Epsilonproteobacteria bacterium]|nr:cytochrome c [Campylobacterota bacterium]
MKKLITPFLILILSLEVSCFANETTVSGKKVFETYCWGCHHQTSVAFGPSWEEIASKRSAEEIQAMITDPKSVSKFFGYKRNAMPPFELTPKELESITEFILSYKPKVD